MKLQYFRVSMSFSIFSLILDPGRNVAGSRHGCGFALFL